jgi:quercetin dioxygenase-like cupin family protein
MRATGARYLLKKGKKFSAEVKDGGEQILFVWRGALKVTDAAGKVYEAGERDTVFVQGAAKMEVVAAGEGETEVIQVQAP